MGCAVDERLHCHFISSSWTYSPPQPQGVPPCGAFTTLHFWQTKAGSAAACSRRAQNQALTEQPAIIMAAKVIISELCQWESVSNGGTHLCKAMLVTIDRRIQTSTANCNSRCRRAFWSEIISSVAFLVHIVFGMI
jgi:hypothetical protein